MTRRRELPPELGEAFAVWDARASGVTARRLDALDLEAPFRGSRMRVEDAPSLDRYDLREYELRRRARAYVPVAPEDAAFSHVTAARLLGMPLPERLFADELHVTTAGQPPRRKGLLPTARGMPDASRCVGLPSSRAKSCGSSSRHCSRSTSSSKRATIS